MPGMEPAESTPRLRLTSRVEEIPHTGPAIARGLREMRLTRVGHLIAHLPTRYERIQPETTIADSLRDHLVTIRATVVATRLGGHRRKPRFEAVLEDETGRLDVVWFNAPYLQRRILPGHLLRVRGKVRLYNRALQLANPEHEIIDPDEPRIEVVTLRPVYPASEHISSRVIGRVIRRVLPLVLDDIEDHLPPVFLRERDLPALRDAYRMVHAPQDEAEAAAGRRRLAYDELLMLQLGVFLRRAQSSATHEAPPLARTPEIDARIRARFPFALTEAQERAIEEIAGDLAQTRPSSRLIQGDVGSGKTVVALYAMLLAVASGHQAALMAPTEILAEQHFATLSAMLAGSRTSIELLTGSTSPSQREVILDRLSRGEIDILVGTHALLSEHVAFRSLALAVIDEQHRFGVHQRASLRTKGDDARTAPHVLVMTATPIPRTLALTVLGDLDISTIDALPPGRTPIQTRVLRPAQRDEAYAIVRERLERGEQAFVVAPLIEQSAHEAVDVRTLADELARGPLAGRRIGLLHGQLARDEREQTMERFRRGEIEVLVATSIIEVGVDVPNASVMVIESAERFGLAQLHQLRGRVGRGPHASICILIAEATTEQAAQRLEVMAKSCDGFEIAQRDLEIRGPGEFFGTAQSGVLRFRAADLARDLDLLTLARRDARQWIERSPRLDRPDEALLCSRMFKAVGEELGLSEVG